jgi:hypothetical protein
MRRNHEGRRIAIIAVAVFVAGVHEAKANLISNGGFEDFTGSFPTVTFAASTPSDYGMWIDRAVWQSVSSGAPSGWTGKNFALQDPASNGQTNTTDALFQGFSGSLAPAASTLLLSFDYLFLKPAGTQGVEGVKIYGLHGGGSWSPFAPFPCISCDTLYFAG